MPSTIYMLSMHQYISSLQRVYKAHQAPSYREENGCTEKLNNNHVLMVTKLVNAKAGEFMASHSNSRSRTFNHCISFLWLL